MSIQSLVSFTEAEILRGRQMASTILESYSEETPFIIVTIDESDIIECLLQLTVALMILDIKKIDFEISQDSETEFRVHILK